eukprot:scaffold2625_cov45-Phaeocystis_antarctica.AAC.1
MATRTPQHADTSCSASLAAFGQLRPRQHACLENKVAAVLGQLAPRRLLSAARHASGCPRRRPAAANQSLGLRWPAVRPLVSTQQHADAEPGQELCDAGRSDVLETGSDEEGI